MDHDTGFAPNVGYALCTLSGCKKNTIEKWAKKGSWVIGIGGNNTGKANKLIYIMKVDENLTYKEFRKRYPVKSKYLNTKTAGPNVLVSKEFYYFGKRAIDLPPDLKHIIFDRHGCKRVSDKDVCKLVKHIESLGFNPGKIGKPNNP